MRAILWTASRGNVFCLRTCRDDADPLVRSLKNVARMAGSYTVTRVENDGPSGSCAGATAEMWSGWVGWFDAKAGSTLDVYVVDNGWNVGGFLMSLGVRRNTMVGCWEDGEARSRVSARRWELEITVKVADGNRLEIRRRATRRSEGAVAVAETVVHGVRKV